MGKKYSQLTLEKRIEIQMLLQGGARSFAEIGRKVGVSATTVAREIRSHVTVVTARLPKDGQRCMRSREQCPVKGGCSVRSCREASCWRCPMACRPGCSSFIPIDCTRRKEPPYVCNGCKKKKICSYEKHYYNAKRADGEATATRSDSRKGFNLTEDEARRISGAIAPLIRDRGFSPYAAVKAVGEEKVGCSVRSIYNYVDGGVLDDLINLDLPRKVRYKPRKGEKKPLKVDKRCRDGRSIEDYHSYLLSMGWSEGDAPVVQMDTVEGRKGTDDKCLLTLHFVRQKLQLAFVRDSNNSASVAEWFRRIRERIGRDAFRKLFPVILTDNGTEFSNPRAIEYDEETGERLTRVFYCDPKCSQQKGSCENNHEMIRRIIPKGTPLTITQEKAQLMMSHINSYPRPIMNGKTPYDAFAFMFGEDILHELGLVRIDATNVILKPWLFED